MGNVASPNFKEVHIFDTRNLFFQDRRQKGRRRQLLQVTQPLLLPPEIRKQVRQHPDPVDPLNSSIPITSKMIKASRKTCRIQPRLQIQLQIMRLQIQTIRI